MSGIFSVGEGPDVATICYMEIKLQDNTTLFGASRDSNIKAAIKALVNGVNRASGKQR